MYRILSCLTELQFVCAQRCGESERAREKKRLAVLAGDSSGGVFRRGVATRVGGRNEMKYTVQGEEFGSKTALQRAWRVRFGEVCKRRKAPKEPSTVCRKPVVKKRGRIDIAGEEADWFIEAAFHFDKQRARLYPEGVDALGVALSANNVFAENASAGFGSLFGGRVPKHLKKCIFFQDKQVPHRFRTVNSMLKDDDLKRDTKTAIIAWLRQAIQPQIDSFRAKDRKYGTYHCFLCACDLKGEENHVDHGVGRDSFREIAQRFQDEGLGRPLTLDDLKGGMTKKWRRYHKTNATLQMTCRTCNLTNK